MDEETKQTEEQPQDPKQPRWIYDLLRMDSYADMTDAEVEAVMKWREDRAKEQAEIEQLEKLSASITEERQAAAKAAAETAKSNLDLIISLIGANYTPGGDDFEPKKPQ